MDFYKDDVVKALLRLQDKGFLRVGLDIPLKLFADVNYWYKQKQSRDEFISGIQSVHCQLLLPRRGLMDVLLQSDYRYQMTLEEYKNNMIEAF